VSIHLALSWQSKRLSTGQRAVAAVTRCREARLDLDAFSNGGHIISKHHHEVGGFDFHFMDLEPDNQDGTVTCEACRRSQPDDPHYVIIEIDGQLVSHVQL
jgi:hypothetical protein